MNLLLVLVLGLIVNLHNNPQIKTYDQVKDAVVHSLKNPQAADWSKLNQ